MCNLHAPAAAIIRTEKPGALEVGVKAAGTTEEAREDKAEDSKTVEEPNVTDNAENSNNKAIVE